MKRSPRKRLHLTLFSLAAITIGAPVESAAADETAPPMATEPSAPAPAPATATTSEPAPEPATTPAATADVAGKPPRAPIVGLRVDGGYAMRELMNLPVTGAGVGLGIGVQLSKHLAIASTPRVFLGSSESGLTVRSLSLGGDVELVIDRLRLGAGLHMILVGFERVTRDVTLLSWGPGLGASARLDFIRADEFSLYLRAAIDASYEVRGESVFWGPTFGAGLDFDLVGRRDAL